MDTFSPGEVLYHKATLLRCVVIKINEDGTIKVRDKMNVEQDYYPQELKRYEKLKVKHSFQRYNPILE